MTDNELNEKVARLEGWFFDDGMRDGYDHPRCLPAWHHPALGRRPATPDYCNDPRLFWPIAEREHMDILWCNDEVHVAPRTLRETPNYVSIWDAPGRAVCLAYLKLREKGDE